MTELPRELEGYRGRHRGATMLVAGCGRSVAALAARPCCPVIGVNDIGRAFDPDYLVVLNPREQFRGDRFRHVEASRAAVVFSTLDLKLRHPCQVRIGLGQRGGTRIDQPGRLPYTRNSPYVALCLARLMGAARIGLIGVDFNDDHFFGHTGAHPLAREFARIDAEYRALAEAARDEGTAIVNLSAESRLTAFPKVDWADLLPAASCEDDARSAAGNSSGPRTTQFSLEVRSTMRVAVERHGPGIVGDFMDALAHTIHGLGHNVIRDVAGTRQRRDVVAIVWNGRHHRSTQPTFYCEHGWLPRWHYQLSPSGINADSHLAPFVWDGKPLSAVEAQQLDQHLATIRSGGPPQYRYMQTTEPPVDDVPEAFILIPLQMEWDTNVQRHVPARLRRMQTFLDHVSAADPPWPLIAKQHPADVRRGNGQLRLKLRRPQDRLWAHEAGNVHQILRTGRCRCIVSLNSNVVHDGLVWDVPAIVLGSNIWPRQQPGPFLTSLPKDWSEVESIFASETTRQCRAAYANYLKRGQWTLTDVRDPHKVAIALRQGVKALGAGPASRPPTARPSARTNPTINIVALNRGWVFRGCEASFRGDRAGWRSDRGHRTGASGRRCLDLHPHPGGGDFA